ncbi:MAG: GNAT family N-acetyltransferase, partial [Actinomycetota bacterium]|nr:GNAT family N-acetyltransferase [Actinomycetota bacterium]
KIEIREASLEHGEEIYALARELAASVGDSPPEREAVHGRLEELLEEPQARVLVAQSGDAVVGAASLWIKPDLAHGDVVVEVPMLVVAEDHRRAGVGKLLVEEVRKLASEKRAGIIELIATSDNTAAREFYRSLGFVETDHVALEYMGDLQDPPEPEEQ